MISLTCQLRRTERASVFSMIIALGGLSGPVNELVHCTTSGLS